jgi:hypothetical protein
MGDYHQPLGQHLHVSLAIYKIDSVLKSLYLHKLNNIHQYNTIILHDSDIEEKLAAARDDWLQLYCNSSGSSKGAWSD